MRDAAAAAGLADPDSAQRTVDDYNEGCKRSADAFGRPELSLVPLEGPPYYCVALYPGGPNTTGGPRRNGRAEILNAFGEVIQGLYGAGELGSAIGQHYPAGGCNLSDAFCFGQIAVETALGVDAR